MQINSNYSMNGVSYESKRQILRLPLNLTPLL